MLQVLNSLPGYTTYEYRGFRITYEHNQHQHIARIYRAGELASWAQSVEAATLWIDAQ